MKKLVHNLSPHRFKMKVKPLRTMEEVVSYAQIFNEQGIPLDKLTPECAISLIDSAIVKRDTLSSLSISKTLAELADLYSLLKNKTGHELLSLKNFDLLKLDVERYMLLLSLRDHVSVLNEVLSPSIFKNSDLAILEEKITKLLAHFNAQYADPQKFNKRIIVIDTNCLMHSLHLLEKIKPSDQLKIPVTVLRELEGLKDDKNEYDQWTDKAKRARAAIDRLNEWKSYEPSHIELVEKMDRASLDSPDINILSVAVYYRLCNSLLLTDDKNLRNMANAEGIVNNSTLEYLASSSSKKSKKRKDK
ncbi:Nucleotide binding protein PINc [Shewanella baltica OS625]|uniref:PIN domain-containing protein n=1 Tax=Shewanella baltica TaxID=62322 RepID=UPI000230E22D|nr:PIN domain-containing protein [Shewanella baltica]EHC05406.1 Nucleotide binding protein PINc [Shewanella baltica OS625]